MNSRLAVPLKIFLLIVAALMCNACTFYCFTNPPLARRLVVSELPAENPEALAKIKADILKDFPPSVGPSETYGYRSVERHSAYDKNSGFYWPMLWGNYRRNTCFLPLVKQRSEPAPDLLLKTKEFGILRPILFGMDTVGCYNVGTGECISRERRVSLFGYLANVQWLTKPTGFYFDADATECLVETNKMPTNADYDRFTSMCLGWGLLAAGTNNTRPYFQILWIPIPLKWY